MTETRRAILARRAEAGRRVAGTVQQLKGGVDSVFGMAGAGRSRRLCSYTVSSIGWWQLKRFLSVPAAMGFGRDFAVASLLRWTVQIQESRALAAPRGV
jgi:hypothetical protein